MAKTSLKHFSVNPWLVTETEYDKDFSLVSESIFSLGNEYMGVRGFLDEGTAYPALNGTYFNGIYEYSKKTEGGYKGISKRTHYMVNAVNFTDLRLSVNGIPVDMSLTPYTDYNRTLNLATGKLTRTLIYKVDGVNLTLNFTRFLDMQKYKRAYQRVTFTADNDCTITLTCYLRFDGKHFGKNSRWVMVEKGKDFIMAKTRSTAQYLACAVQSGFDTEQQIEYSAEKKVSLKTFTVNLKKGVESVFTRLVSVSSGTKNAKEDAYNELKLQAEEGYDKASLRNDLYWQDFWNKSDIEIVGDDDNQQGIRFCIFQLQQTYHGAKEGDNIGAKGLTGEAYSGNAFWDTESYCLPYYLFNNLDGAKSLLEFRYKTLEAAKQRAKDLDLQGACYPIATISGEEACTLWQHASLQMQPSTAVAYGIYHYYNVSGDSDYLYTHGGEMLIEICRYLLSRGQWSKRGDFGYYCVMGPDEFQMMVNHNTYTNFMAKKTFLFTIEVLDNMPKDKLDLLIKKTGLQPKEKSDWLTAAKKMRILYDEKTMLYEQHEGFFDLPHIDVDSISDKEFPLYSHWSYDRIYRNDMIKQPDVLMFQLLYSGDFTRECKKANYEYYEPLCIHESSLSPSVHSIIATEIGKYDEALKFFKFATRLDLDDYNRNTKEGLHTTSISAAWLNIVYGFAGLRSDKEISISPMLPKSWKSYSFKITVKGCVVKISVTKDNVIIENLSKIPLNLLVYGKNLTVSDKIILKNQ